MRGNHKGTLARTTGKSNSSAGKYMVFSIIFIVFFIIAALLFTNLHISPGDSKSLVNLDKAIEAANQFVVEHTAPHKAPDKIAYVFAGSVRSFVCPKVHWSLKQNLIDALGGEPYVFIRTSTEDNRNIKTGNGTIYKPKYDQIDIDETLKLLNPRDITYFSLATQFEEMIANFPGDVHTVFRENDQRRYSMFFHRCMAYRMVLKYELAHQMKFDWVVLVRLDAAWLEPVLPIEAYAKDRVWITETGYDRFNDQFMLIPRQFSDYLYDLNTKVRKEVYCLGGPDVELWKCNATELASRGIDLHKAGKILEHCCPDVQKDRKRGGNVIGRSERIHYMHLRQGKIPIGIARFPVFLTRRMAWKECVPECFRIYAYHYKEYVFRFGANIYPYMGPPAWPDTRGRSISSRDRSLCYLMGKEEVYPWKPATAVSIHTKNPMLAVEKTLSARAKRIAESQAKSGRAIDFSSEDERLDATAMRQLEKWKANFTAQAQRHVTYVDYSRPLVDQLEYVHPSVMLNPKDTEAWQIHPTWNVEGCLTFRYDSKQLGWDYCKGHSWKKTVRYDARHLFFLYVVPTKNIGHQLELPSYHRANWFPESTFSAAVSNVTRVVHVDSNPTNYDFHKGALCLTARAVALQAAVTMQPCVADSLDPRQTFLTVRTEADGSHPQSTVGQLSFAANPDLCVVREDNVKRDHSVFPDGDRLHVFHCNWGAQAHRTNFEFELVNS